MTTSKQIINSLVESILSEIDPDKVKALYDRPGTPGEKQAALAALKRMGHTPKEPTQPRSTGPKKFRVTLKYTHNNKDLHFGPHETEASDGIDAEHKIRQMAKDHWKMTVGGSAPEFKAHSTERI